MTATAIGLKDQSTTARRVLSESVTGTRKTYTDTWLVQTDTTDDQEDEILAAANLPALRSLGRNAYLREHSAREVIAGVLWEVDCIYDSHIEGIEPVFRSWWTDEEIEEALMYDQVTGNPLVNSVGELQLTSTSVQLQVLNIMRLEAAPFNPDVPRLYGGRVNSTTFYGAPPGTARLKGPSTSPRAISGQLWEEVHYKIQFNFTLNPATLQPKGWQLHYLNHGTKYKSTVSLPNGDPRLYADQLFEIDGDRTTGNLNLDGTKRDPNLAPIWIAANRFPLADLNQLNLGPY